jgi:hypothetical protein
MLSALHPEGRRTRPWPVSLPSLPLLLLAAVLAWPVWLAPAQAAGPARRDPAAQPADCAACHGDAAVLPRKHKAVQPMKWADCLECHERADADSTLAGKLPAAHAHALAGEGCASCHGATGKPAAVATERCLSCHALDKLVARTAQVKPKNPHTSPHYGKELDCDNCHVQHGRSVNFCNDCHEYAFRVP